MYFSKKERNINRRKCFLLIIFNLLTFYGLKKDDFEKESVELAVKQGIILAFQNLQTINLIYKMVALICLKEVKKSEI